MSVARSEDYLHQYYGPLDDLLADPEVVEIMVNGHQQIFIEKRGQLIDTQRQFEDEEALVALIQRIARPLGRELNESYPLLDLRLPDGSRVYVVGRPIALGGPSLTIRKFARKPLTAEDLIGFGAWTEEMVTFLRACVQAQLNIVVAGGTGSGKTTVQNILASMIPSKERIITVEHTAELMFDHPHKIALETRPPNLEGRGEISMKHLVDSATKMRPDRIIAGEMHGGEMYTLIMAVNNGYSGSMLNLHATSAHDVLLRMEIMMADGNPSLPILAIREQLANALDLVLYQQRLRDGNRRIMNVAEVLGVENGSLVLKDIYQYVQTGYDKTTNRVTGSFTATGRVPACLTRLADVNDRITEDFFTPYTPPRTSADPLTHSCC